MYGYAIAARPPRPPPPTLRRAETHCLLSAPRSRLHTVKLCWLPESPYHHKSVTDRDGARLDVRATTSYDAAAQVLRFTLDYLRDGVCVRTKKVSMRCFFPEELLALCRLAGLDVAQRYGDYDQSLFTSTSPKQLLFCHSRTASGQIGDPLSVPVMHPS